MECCMIQTPSGHVKQELARLGFGPPLALAVGAVVVEWRIPIHTFMIERESRASAAAASS